MNVKEMKRQLRAYAKTAEQIKEPESYELFKYDVHDFPNEVLSNEEAGELYHRFTIGAASNPEDYLSPRLYDPYTPDTIGNILYDSCEQILLDILAWDEELADARENLYLNDFLAVSICAYMAGGKEPKIKNMIRQSLGIRPGDITLFDFEDEFNILKNIMLYTPCETIKYLVKYDNDGIEQDELMDQEFSTDPLVYGSTIFIRLVATQMMALIKEAKPEHRKKMLETLNEWMNTQIQYCIRNLKSWKRVSAAAGGLN